MTGGNVEKAPNARLGMALAAFSAATFGFGTTFSRLAYDGGSNPLTVVLLRFAAFVLVIGLGLLLLRRPMRLSRRAFFSTSWMAATLAMVSIGYQVSVAFIPVSLAALLFYCYPLIVGLIAVAARRDTMTLAKAAALLAAFAGLGLALGPGFESLDWRGVGCALIAALGMALTITFGGAAMRGQDPIAMSLYTNLWMLITLGSVVALAGAFAPPVTRLGAVGAAGVCLSYVVAYSVWYLALGRVRPVRLAAIFNIEPLVTVAAASVVLGERLSATQLVGAALVLGSVVAISARPAEAGDQP